MNQFDRWGEDLRVERTMEALEKNGFGVGYVGSAAAAPEIFSMIPDRAVVGVGGSMPLNVIGFFEGAA